MSHDVHRRQILKAAGAVGAGSLVAVGSVGAESCEETVDEYTYGNTAVVDGTLPLVGNGEVGGVYATTDPFSTDGFADAEHEGRRIRVTYEWNATEQGPNGSRIRLERELFEGEWEAVAEKAAGDLEPAGPNRIDLEVVDGESPPGVSRDAIVEDGETYRLYIEQPNSVGVVVQYDVQVEFEAFDPDC